MRTLSALCGIFALALASAGLAADPIKIGVEAAFVGSAATAGLSARTGIRIATEEINADGGVLGRRIVLIERDDEGKNENGVQIAQEMIDKERVVAALGYSNTGVALAGQRFYEEAGIPVITCAATGSVITKQFLPPQYPTNFIFRVGAFDTLQAEMIVTEAVDRAHYTRVAILADSSNYGQLGRGDLTAALSKRGMTPVTVEKFNVGDVDMTAQLLKAREADAQIILTYGLPSELAQIARGLNKLAWKVPLMGSWTLASSAFIDAAASYGEGALMPVTFVEEGTTPRRKAFIEANARISGASHMAYPSPSAQGYDAMLLLAAAIRQAGTLDGDKIRLALENLQAPVDGVITTYVHPFSAEKHEALTDKDAAIGRVSNGRVIYNNPVDSERVSRQ